ncbi:hypothetical protein [Georgenia deserti]|uniref:Uncharacterized protein n=1 Tax=Georgenia deserti TaxID=2093781 RepID=A0ABW4L7D3_9MICO
MSDAAHLSPWTEADAARLAACRAHVELRKQQPLTPPLEVSVTFRPVFGPDELMLAAGPFELLNFQAVGDGSYRRGGAFFLGTGPVGLAATGVVAAATYATNRSRKKKAQADAQPRWVKVDAGHLIVSDRGFYLDTPSALHAWNYEDVHQVEMAGPGELLLAGRSAKGPVRWILRSPWAELVFVLWVNRYQPQHPQLGSGAWLPPGWIEHVRAHGKAGPVEGAGRLIDR